MTFSTRTMRDDDWSKVRFFTKADFRHPEKIGFEFVMWLDRVRMRAGVPMTITSDYRDAAYNKRVGGAQDSAHSDDPCNSADVGMRPRSDDPNWNYSRWSIVAAAMALGCARIGVYANGSLHLDRTEDSRPAPRMWHVVDRPAK